MDFPSNSHKETAKPEKPEPKKLEKIATGEVTRRKKPLGKRFHETFIGGDAQSVWGYVMFDVLIPAAKDMFVDAISQGSERMFYGEGRGRKRNSPRPSGGSGYVSYNRYTTPKPEREEPRTISRRSRATHDFDEVILATRVEAEEVITRLFDLVSQYESATVADLYELVGVTGSYTDEKWGWTDIRGAGATQIRGGYLLDLPKPEPLD